MTMYILKGGKNEVEFEASTIRNMAVMGKRGCVIVRNDGSDAYSLLEKIINGVRISPKPYEEARPIPASEIPWKSDPVIIFINDASRLREFESIVPGFTAAFGPPVVRSWKDGEQ